MRVFGLTGGIASGKSTVAALLRELGAPVVDADALAREVVAPGSPGLAEIVARFGDQVLLPDGQLDRKQVGALVFGDDEARQALEAITHPRIAAAGQERLAALRAAGEPVAFYEAALIVEKGLQRGLDGLVVVAVPEPVQIERLRARDGIDAEAARARIRAQLPLADKVAAATHVIDNAGTRASTRRQVEELWTELQDQGDGR